MAPAAQRLVDRLRPAALPRGDGGMTLLELMVVAGVLSVLIGLGVGFLRQSDGMPETRSALAGELRRAALDARTRGLPTEVLVEVAAEDRPAGVVARGLDAVVLVTFEPGQRYAVAGLEPVLGGLAVEHGRCGQARSGGGDDTTAALRLPLPPSVADLAAGFALRVDVLLPSRAAGRLLRLGRAIDVELDGEARPRVRLQAVDQDGRSGAAVNLRPDGALPVGRWCTFEIGHDGYQVWCAVDGRTLATANLKERVVQQKGDVLELLPAEELLPAVVDELQVFAYVFGERQRLPDGVVLETSVRIAFDADGEPIAPKPIRFEVLVDRRTEQLTVGRGGVLQ